MILPLLNYARQNGLNAGFYAGIGKANMTEAKGKTSVGLGLHIEYKTGHFNFVLRPLIDWRGYRYSGNIFSQTWYKFTYLDMPVLLEYCFVKRSPVTPYIGVGVYGGLALKGSYKSDDDSKGTLRIGEGIDDNRSPVDYGLAFDIGYRFTKGGTGFGLAFNVGQKNIVPEARQASYDAFHLNNFQFFVVLCLSDRMR